MACLKVPQAAESLPLRERCKQNWRVAGSHFVYMFLPCVALISRLMKKPCQSLRRLSRGSYRGCLRNFRCAIRFWILRLSCGSVTVSQYSRPALLDSPPVRSEELELRFELS